MVDVANQIAEHCHTPIKRTLMKYEYNGKTVTHTLNLQNIAATELLIRTAKWASAKGVSIILLPM